MKSIYRIRQSQPETERSPTEPIKLLEVNEFTIPAGVIPLGIPRRSQEGIDYPYIVVDVYPQPNSSKFSRNSSKLPEGWIVAEELPRSQEANGDE